MSFGEQGRASANSPSNNAMTATDLEGVHEVRDECVMAEPVNADRPGNKPVITVVEASSGNDGNGFVSLHDEIGLSVGQASGQNKV